MHNLGSNFSGLGWKEPGLETTGIMIVGDISKKSGTLMIVFSTYDICVILCNHLVTICLLTFLHGPIHQVGCRGLYLLLLFFFKYSARI